MRPEQVLVRDVCFACPVFLFVTTAVLFALLLRLEAEGVGGGGVKAGGGGNGKGEHKRGGKEKRERRTLPAGALPMYAHGPCPR